MCSISCKRHLLCTYNYNKSSLSMQNEFYNFHANIIFNQKYHHILYFVHIDGLSMSFDCMSCISLHFLVHLSQDDAYTCFPDFRIIIL